MYNEADARDAPFLPPEEGGPVQPSEEVKNELRGYLAADSSRVGEVHRLI